ncbi:MAG: ankyrin repeat domain-containing protein [Hyphomicrobiaceae bacterium]|nr:ankyrin repeat domain-containing protein [Hyphomicrobiaceae bacterium]
MVSRLLENRADCNAGTAEGRTALMEAAFHGHKGLLEPLFQAGAEVDTVDLHGVSALNLARL